MLNVPHQDFKVTPTVTVHIALNDDVAATITDAQLSGSIGECVETYEAKGVVPTAVCVCVDGCQEVDVILSTLEVKDLVP